MSIFMLQPISIVRPAEKTDRYGNVVPDWENATTTEIPGVNVQPAVSHEQEGDRQAVTTGWRVVAPRGVDLDLRRTDRVLYDGMTLEVDGDAGRWYLAGGLHHVEATLKRVAG